MVTKIKRHLDVIMLGINFLRSTRSCGKDEDLSPVPLHSSSHYTVCAGTGLHNFQHLDIPAVEGE
ncbi:hypothetical protein F2P79_025784 [Pimephales promelas]|nr:hypothetical protein F2P79_025784 [Pimephales promelas]